MINAIVVGVLTLCTLFLLAYIIYLKFRRRYTRDRYAFAALAATCSITLLTIMALTSVPPWTGVAQVVATILGRPVALVPTSHWSENLLVIVFAMFSVWLIHRVFINWDGPISVRHHRMLRFYESTNFLFEGVQELRRVFHREPPSEVYLPPDNGQRPSALRAPEESFSWRENARELVELRWQYYYFDADDGWHARQNCWIGEDVKTGVPVALMCVHEKPSLEQLRGFIEYVETIADAQMADTELLVAVRTNCAVGVQSILDRQIRFETEASLLEDLVDFTDYIADIRKRVEVVPLPDSDLKPRDIYVESQVEEGYDASKSYGLESYLLEWLREPGQRQLAFLGEYGQGKSTGALMFTYNVLTGTYGGVEHVPLLVELRGKSPATLQPIELIGAWASHYRIDPRALLKLLQVGRLCMIFEGFDEMSGVADPEARLAHFRTLWRFCYPQAKILISGRPNFFLDDQELQAALGIAVASGAGPYCQAIHLKPFTVPQIEKSLRWTDASVRQEIVDLAKADEKFQDLVCRPSLLYIIARLWGSPQLASRREDMTSALVMGTFIEHCYRRQTEKHRDFPEFMVLTEAERRFFTDGLAVYMVANTLQNQLTRTQFEEAITSLYTVFPEAVTATAAALPDEPARPLKARLEGRDDALEAVITDVRTCGLLVRDFSRHGALKFPHKSFFEFLFGNYIARELIDIDKEVCRAIQAATSISSEAIIDMPEAMAFAGEVIADSLEQSLNYPGMLMAFMNRIVFPKKYTQIAFLQCLIIWENVHEKMDSIKRSIYPSIIIWALMFGIIVTIFSTYSNNIKYLGPTISMLITLLVFSYTFRGMTRYIAKRTGRKRNLCLWYYIVKSLGYTDKDIALVYGDDIAMGLRLVSEATFESELNTIQRPDDRV